MYLHDWFDQDMGLRSDITGGQLAGIFIKARASVTLCFLARKITTEGAKECKSYTARHVHRAHYAVKFPFGLCCVPGQAMWVW
jgi:hypothetical protein